MYNYLKGKLVEKTPTYVVIDVGGIGFMVNISLTTYSKIKDQENIKLFTHFAVREDAHVLYGFSDINERLIFEKLITVSGVGANTARLILSSLTTDEAYDAIVQSKADVLQGVKGIGGKTAQRIIIDLKDKVSLISENDQFIGNINHRFCCVISRAVPIHLQPTAIYQHH